MLRPIFQDLICFNGNISKIEFFFANILITYSLSEPKWHVETLPLYVSQMENLFLIFNYILQRCSMIHFKNLFIFKPFPDILHHSLIIWYQFLPMFENY